MIDVYVSQLMTEELITVDKSQTLAEAGGAMTEAEIKSVVVSDETDRPLGILTSSDFVQLAAAEAAPTTSQVEECMTTDIVTTTAKTVVHDAAALMLEHDISHLPVVDEDGRLTGIVTTTDVAAYVSGLDGISQK